MYYTGKIIKNKGAKAPFWIHRSITDYEPVIELDMVGVPQVLVMNEVLGCTKVTVEVRVPSTGSSPWVLCASSNLTVMVMVVAEPAAALVRILMETKFVAYRYVEANCLNTSWLEVVKS